MGITNRNTVYYTNKPTVITGTSVINNSSYDWKTDWNNSWGTNYIYSNINYFCADSFTFKPYKKINPNIKIL